MSDIHKDVLTPKPSWWFPFVMLAIFIICCLFAYGGVMYWWEVFTK